MPGREKEQRLTCIRMLRFRAGRHTSSGAAVLTLVVQITGIVIILGCLLLFICLYFGGMREFENVNDMGSLNVAKQLLKRPLVTLEQGTTARNNFDGLTEGTHQVNLCNLNRLLGQTLLIGMNARTEGTPDALANATMVANCFRKVEESLHDLIITSQVWHSDFDQTATANATVMLRMLETMSNGKQRIKSEVSERSGSASTYGVNDHQERVNHSSYVEPERDTESKSKIDGAKNSSMRKALYASEAVASCNLQVSCMKVGGATNVFIDKSLRLPGRAEIGTISRNGKAYLCGYQPQLVIPGVSVEGVSVQPGDRPHLLSVSDFRRSRKMHPSNILPANAILATSKGNFSNGLSVNAVSAAIVGSLQKDFRAAIPYGYIAIENGSSLAREPINFVEPKTWIVVYLANNSSFALQAAPLIAWSRYNARTSKVRPSLMGVYRSNGRAVHSLDDPAVTNISGITRVIQGVEAQQFCARLGVQVGENGTAERASRSEIVTNSSNSLMAIEAFDFDLVRAWSDAWHSPSGWCDGRFSATVLPPPETGLRILNKGRHKVNKPRPNPEGSLHPQVSHAGSFMQLVDYICADMGASSANTKSELLCAITQRITEIGAFSEQEIQSVLNSEVPIDLGETAYIYSTNGKLVMSKVPPPGLVPNSRVDGETTRPLSTTYSIPDLMQELPVKIPGRPFLTRHKDNGANAHIALDQLRWTPSSGYNNLLGTASFSNTVVGRAGETVIIKI